MLVKKNTLVFIKCLGMTLHEAIQNLLHDKKRPLDLYELAELINENNLYIRKDGKEISATQIRSRVRQYPEIFQNINGIVLLVNDKKWGALIRTYWYILDSLRSYYSINELQFILAVSFYLKRSIDIGTATSLLSKDFRNRLDFLLPNSITHKQIDYILNQRSKDLNESEILNEYLSLVNKMGYERTNEILSSLKAIDTKDYSNIEFGSIYEYLINLPSLESSTKGQIHNTTSAIRDLIIRLLAPKSTGTVYDPVCGTAGLLIEAKKYTANKIKLRGSELDHRTAQLGFLNLKMHGFDSSDIKEQDCFNELKNSERFEYIVGDLPLKTLNYSKINSDIFNDYGIDIQTNKGFGGFILFILNKLKPNGKAVVTVSESFLSKKGKEKSVRDVLISQDLLEAVVSLPYGALRPFTEGKAAILVINKNKPQELRDKVKFIQAQAVEGNKTSLDIDTDNVLALYTDQKVADSSKAQIVNHADLFEDTNLSPNSYDAEYFLTKEMLERGGGKFLQDLVEIKSGAAIEKKDLNPEGELPIVKIENLSKDISEIYLSSEGLNSKIYYNKKFDKYVVNDECIIIARLGENLKPTYFKPTDKLPQIVLHNGVYALFPKNNPNINLEYLYYQLHTIYVKEQLTKRRISSVIPHISISGIKDLLIPYVDIRLQNEFVLTQKANIIAAERAKIEEKIKAIGYKEEISQVESDIVRTLVHQLRPTLLAIDLEVNTLGRIVERNSLNTYREYDEVAFDNISYDEEISHLINKPINYCLGEILAKIKSDTLQLNEILSTVNKVMSFKLTDNDMEGVELKSFFIQYIEIKKIEIGNKFLIEITGEEVTALINKSSFVELIDQLVSNAEKHGFSDKTNIVNKINFHIKYNKEKNIAIIEYSNNGKPYALSQRDFITAFHKGQSSNGSGIGGNYIYRIIQAHKGVINIREGIKNGFMATIELPINNSNE